MLLFIFRSRRCSRGTIKKTRNKLNTYKYKIPSLSALQLQQLISVYKWSRGLQINAKQKV